MPSVLAEISFLSNANDEKMLKKADQRQRMADGLYRGVAAYLDSVNSLSSDKSKLVSDNHIRVPAEAPPRWPPRGTQSSKTGV